MLMLLILWKPLKNDNVETYDANFLLVMQLNNLMSQDYNNLENPDISREV